MAKLVFFAAWALLVGLGAGLPHRHKGHSTSQRATCTSSTATDPDGDTTWWGYNATSSTGTGTGTGTTTPLGRPTSLDATTTSPSTLDATWLPSSTTEPVAPTTADEAWTSTESLWSTWATNPSSTTSLSATTTTSAPTTTSVSTDVSSASPTSSTAPVGVWQPPKGISWNYDLSTTLTNPSKAGFDVWNIDLFSNTQATISSLQQQGAKVICYFSAGSYENWRPDISSFVASDLGNGLAGWPGEQWLNTNSANVRSIMAKRLDLAVQKGCDGVDPDNVDGYNNDNGLGLTQADAVDYLQFLAGAAHTRNLAIGLKNAGEIVPTVIGTMQWSVNEQCIQFSECSIFAPFIAQGKPVFHVEYPKGTSTNNDLAVASDAKTSVCDAASVGGFSTILKNMNLDTWVETC